MVLTKKINLLPLLLILLLLLNCNKSRSYERKCTDFHLGDFYAESSDDDGNTYRTTFSRNGSNIQIEEYDGKIDSSYIRWVNDCEMILSPVNPKKMSEKKNIFIKILTTNDSSYTFEYSFLGQSDKFKGKAIKIR